MTFEYMLKERERKGLEQGLEQGRSEGLAEGAAQEKREIAKAMKKKNMDLSVIQELTALPLEEIEKL